MTKGIALLDALDNLVTGIAFRPIKQTKDLRLMEVTSFEHGLGSLAVLQSMRSQRVRQD